VDLALTVRLTGLSVRHNWPSAWPTDTQTGAQFVQLYDDLMQGLPSLRAFPRERLARLEGREPAESELLVTRGAIEGLELLGKSFLDPGDTVVVEAPTYMGAYMAFRRERVPLGVQRWSKSQIRSPVTHS
jgi:DNA-binding transcriptional MocR family regulator